MAGIPFGLSLVDTIIAVVKGMGLVTSLVFNKVTTDMDKDITDIEVQIGGVQTKIKTAVQDVYDKVKPGVDATLETIGIDLDDAIEVSKTAVLGVTGRIYDELTTETSTLRTAIGNIEETVIGEVGGVLSTLDTLMRYIADTVGGAIADVWDKTEGIRNKSAAAIRTLVEGTISALEFAINNVTTFLTTILGPEIVKIGSGIGDAAEAIGGFAADASGAISGLPLGIASALASSLFGPVDALRELLGTDEGGRIDQDRLLVTVDVTA